MRILVIKPKHIGDTLILTPTLTAIHQNYPSVRISVVVRQGCQKILLGCPAVERIFTVAAVDKNERKLNHLVSEITTWLSLLNTRFDYVFELGDGHRGRLLASSVSTSHRISVSPAEPLKSSSLKPFTVSKLNWESLHRVEKDFFTVKEFLPLNNSTPPPLTFVRERTRPWPEAAQLSNFAVVQIGKRQASSRWPIERWIATCKALLSHLSHIVISSGPAPDEVAEAKSIQAELGNRILITQGRADWPQLADLLYRAKFYLGLDTAAMHLAAACGCPIVALFGPTRETHWRPWNRPDAIILNGGCEVVTDEELLARSMLKIETVHVIAACLSLLAKPGRE